ARRLVTRGGAGGQGVVADHILACARDVAARGTVLLVASGPLLQPAFQRRFGAAEAVQTMRFGQRCRRLQRRPFHASHGACRRSSLRRAAPLATGASSSAWKRLKRAASRANAV